MSFLSYVIFSGGNDVELSKVDVVLQWETLKSINEIKSFLGLDDYYRRFI